MNAIILAAGCGSRLHPITYETPKGLLLIQGETLIDRQISYLYEISIEHIYIVIGYKKERFRYLETKYANVSLVVNEEFANSNNLYSLYLCRQYLSEDTWILECDIFLSSNFLKKYKFSFYYTALKSIEENEWIFMHNPEDMHPISGC